MIFEDYETTPYETTAWVFVATSYDPVSDALDLLTVESYEDGVVYIIAKANVTIVFMGTCVYGNSA